MTPYEIEIFQKMLAALKEVSPEITRINEAAGETQFNPTATSMVRSVLPEAETLLRNDTIAPEAVDSCGNPIGTRGLDYYLVIGTNQCWGRGFSIDEALKNASKPKHYVVYKANTRRTPIMCCTDMGGYSYRGEEPVEIERKLPKQKKVKVAVEPNGGAESGRTSPDA